MVVLNKAPEGCDTAKVAALPSHDTPSARRLACRFALQAQPEVEGLPDPKTPFWVNCDIRRSS
jgi:hypothetical protein